MRGRHLLLAIALSLGALAWPATASASRYKPQRQRVEIFLGLSQGGDTFSLGGAWGYFVLDGFALGTRLELQAGDDFSGELLATARYLPLTSERNPAFVFIEVGGGGILVLDDDDGGVAAIGAGLSIPTSRLTSLDLGVRASWRFLPGRIQRIISPIVSVTILF